MRYLKGRGIRFYRQLSSIRVLLSLRQPSPFLASSKIEIFHPSELICTDWLTSSEFPDRHVNPRGFDAHLYEGASARSTHADRLFHYKAKSCSEEVLQWFHYSITSKRISILVMYRHLHIFEKYRQQRGIDNSVTYYQISFIYVYRLFSTIIVLHFTMYTSIQSYMRYVL